jgi:hypothetical protein
MNKLRLIDAKPELVRIAGVTGMAFTDARFLTRLNRAIEELMNEGDWPGVVDRYHFKVYGGIIVLPGDLNRIAGVAADGTPREMMAPWYEFVASGPGPQESAGWLDHVIDRGETCVLQPIPGATATFLEVVGEVDERSDPEDDATRPKLIIRGWGEDGAWIRSTIGGARGDGLEVAINGDTEPKLTLSSVKFTGIASVIKPRTQGYVHLYCTIDDVRYHLATYAPNETLPSYRKYFVPNLDPKTTHTVLVRARKRFVLVRDDNDFLLVTHMGALESMIMALQKREEEDYVGYASLKAIAVDLLKKEAGAYRGTARKPAVTFSQGSAIGYMPHVR